MIVCAIQYTTLLITSFVSIQSKVTLPIDDVRPMFAHGNRRYRPSYELSHFIKLLYVSTDGLLTSTTGDTKERHYYLKSLKPIRRSLQSRIPTVCPQSRGLAITHFWVIQRSTSSRQPTITLRFTAPRKARVAAILFSTAHTQIVRREVTAPYI